MNKEVGARREFEVGLNCPAWSPECENPKWIFNPDQRAPASSRSFTLCIGACELAKGCWGWGSHGGKGAGVGSVVEMESCRGPASTKISLARVRAWGFRDISKECEDRK